MLVMNSGSESSAWIFSTRPLLVTTLKAASRSVLMELGTSSKLSPLLGFHGDTCALSSSSL